MNILKIFFLLDAIAAGLFSVINIYFHFDIAILAFPVAVAFNAILCYLIYFRLLKNPSRNVFQSVKKMLQYQPFLHLIVFILRRAGENGTSRVFDAFCVLFWLFSFVFSLVILFYIGEKRIAKTNSAWTEYSARIKRKGVAWLGFELLDWVDALVQAVFMVLLFQIFFFQFYKIPSESMVPTLLVNDRLMVSKITSGPKFPLSDIGIPDAKNYKRGDIVVFRNPHYESGRKEEVKSVVSELVYMLTFTFVNLNVDENGHVKADPLVKHITGLPGEQLVMLDGVLYSRTKDSPEFAPVKDDAIWAKYNLNDLDEKTKAMIQEFKISDEVYKEMCALEAERNSLHIDAAAKECFALAEKFTKLSGHSNDTLPKFKSEYSDFISGDAMFVYNIFRENFTLTTKLLSSPQGTAWFNAFMSDWNSTTMPDANGLYGGDIYSDSMFRLNLMTKLVVGRFVVRNAELIQKGVSTTDFANDAVLQKCWHDAQNIFDYTLYLDGRNMPVFPANNADGTPQFIPDDCYFMMGDNRFNSLDMRHSYEARLTPIFAADKYSPLYYSNMAPQYVHKNRILGTAVFRFWPKGRIGKINALN